MIDAGNLFLLQVDDEHDLWSLGYFYEEIITYDLPFRPMVAYDAYFSTTTPDLDVIMRICQENQPVLGVKVLFDEDMQSMLIPLGLTTKTNTFDFLNEQHFLSIQSWQKVIQKFHQIPDKHEMVITVGDYVNLDMYMLSRFHHDAFTEFGKNSSTC